MPLELSALLKSAEREVALRRRVYPKQIATGRMTHQMAAHEIQAMNEIVELIRAAIANNNTGPAEGA